MGKDNLIEYASLIKDVKDKIYERQYETLKHINSQTINLYWEIGEEIYNQQKEKDWGKSVVEILARELQKEFPGAKGNPTKNPAAPQPYLQPWDSGLYRIMNLFLTLGMPLPPSI